MKLSSISESVDAQFQRQLIKWLETGCKPPETQGFRWSIEVAPGAERQSTSNFLGSELATPFREREASATVQLRAEPTVRWPENILAIVDDWSPMNLKVWAEFGSGVFKAAVLEEAAYGESCLLGSPTNKKSKEWGFSVIADIVPVKTTVSKLVSELNTRMTFWATDLRKCLDDDDWLKVVLGQDENTAALRRQDAQSDNSDADELDSEDN